MKTSMIKFFLLILAAAGVAGVTSSCKKSKAAPDKTCTVAFILNETNAAGDTVFVKGTAGELIQNAPVPARTGFNFKGWYTNSADANPNPTKNTAAPLFPAYDITVKPIYLDAILYARWAK
ncbi:MAG TPA: InlB B-repeat-containing protein [Puia sp.]